MERVKKAAPADFPMLLEQWKILFPEGDDYLEGRPENALRFLLAMWLVKDADGFLKMVTVRDYPYSQWAAQVLARTMPEKTVELVFGPARGELGEYFVAGMAMELAERHPGLYLKASPDDSIDPTPRYSGGAWETAIINLAKTDAVAAANACLKLNDEERYSTKFTNAILAVASAWKPGDPSMVEWVKGIADPMQRNIATNARLCALAEKDPHAALEELPSVKWEVDNDLSDDAAREILRRLATADPASALRVMRETEELFLKSKRNHFDDSSSQEMEANPFMDLISDHYDDRPSVQNNGVRHQVLSALADDLPDDPAAFFPALRKLSGEGGDGGDGGRSWQLGIEAGVIRLKCEDWSADECLTVVGLWENELKGSSDDPTWQKLAERAAKANPERVLTALYRLPESARSVFVKEIVKNLPDGFSDQKVALLSHLPAGQWDRDLGDALGGNPAAYSEVVASLPVETTLKAREAFMEQWGELDPEAAARWLESLPDDAASKPAAAGLASSWAAYDSYAASSWAASLPAGPSRDAAAASLSYSFAKNHPEESWRWANSISDPEARDEALVYLDYRWEYDAPQKYRAALDNARRARGKPERGAKPPPDPNDPFSR